MRREFSLQPSSVLSIEDLLLVEGLWMYSGQGRKEAEKWISEVVPSKAEETMAQIDEIAKIIFAGLGEEMTREEV